MKKQEIGDTLLKLCRLSVGYGKKAIISNIDLELECGQFMCILGPNGTGKTTLLRTISRHLAPLSGKILLKGKALKEYAQADLARIMAVVLTEKVAPPLFSVYQFVALGRYPYTDFLGRLRPADKEAVEEALILVNAQELKERAFSSLSDGERQKVLLARALCQEPELLLLDEPTAHLDLKHRVEVMSILRRLCMKKKITILCSVHDVDIAAKVSDRVALIREGMVTDCGYPEEVLTPETVARLYDFESACFNNHLGSIEIRGDGQRGKVFVVAGMGSGAAIYRLLAKRGYKIITGILLTNDLDCFVAKSLGAECISIDPDAGVGQDIITLGLSKMAGCDLVIDAGFSNNNSYGWNHSIIKKAAGMGKPVFSLRQGQGKRCPDGASSNIIFVDGATRLFEVMEKGK